eukprot:TRINITY_DN29949_c0_g1_i1.p2 TRINITY_DN29949_c0_g1~~TRINITY_DN29949_c0_g1_i1.p2  ORF type:complete len:120 (+),score=8.90 TRINITY_DN29949_c0_g1_i1:40-399(+)
MSCAQQVSLIACACKRAVLGKAMDALGDIFWGAYKEMGLREGWTVLHAAAARNRADLLKGFLLSGRLAVDTVVVFGGSACSVAAEYGCVDALQILIAEGRAAGRSLSPTDPVWGGRSFM